jgi:hypothetical protein
MFGLVAAGEGRLLEASPEWLFCCADAPANGTAINEATRTKVREFNDILQAFDKPHDRSCDRVVKPPGSCRVSW